MKPKEKTQMLEKSIEELRRMHDEVCSKFSKAQTKNVTFLGGGLAVLAYLYSDARPGEPISKALFIPPETYGIVFYAIGLFCSLYGMTLLFAALQPVLWRMPTELKVQTRLKFDTYDEYLEYLREEYLEALHINLPHNTTKQNTISKGFYLLVIGAIVLAVIKKFS